MARRKRLTVVAYNCSHGLVYQRLHLPLMHLDPDKYDIRCIDLEDFRHVNAHYTDVIIMPQPWAPAYCNLADSIKVQHKKKVIIDVDDLVSEMPSDHPEYALFQGHKLPQIIQCADHVVYSTNYLKDRLGHLNTTHTVVPNTTSVNTFNTQSPRPKAYKNCFMVGWTGGQSHRPDQYNSFLPGLSQFLRNHPDAKAYFHILCPQQLLAEFGTQIIYEPNPVDYMDYPAMAASYPFDVCLVGLPNNNFNNAKSDLKLLEMAPNKVPLIASPRSDFAQHNEREIMFYAEDNSSQCKSWLEALEYCYENQHVVKQYGDRAHDYVLSNRMSDKSAIAWEKVIDSVFES